LAEVKASKVLTIFVRDHKNCHPTADDSIDLEGRRTPLSGSRAFSYGAMTKPLEAWRWPGLTTYYCVSIVRRLEHGAFLVLTCGGALLIEAGRGINVIVA